jgi:putative Mg2+ transporter-C (MgtC) family protein
MRLEIGAAKPHKILRSRRVIALISDLDITLRLLVAAGLGSLIGFERERLLWAAGIRTHMLVSVGACLLMIVSAYGFQHILQEPHVVLDPSRVAAQVVSGIGFLGAGAILLRGQVVRGLTTAASIWAVAAVGLAAGGGLYFAATVSTAIILVILAGLKPVEEAYRERVQSGAIEAIAEHGAITSENAKKLLGLRANQIRRLVIEDVGAGRTQRVTISVARVTADDVDRSVDRLRRSVGVHGVEMTPKRKGRAERLEASAQDAP